MTEAMRQKQKELLEVRFPNVARVPNRETSATPPDRLPRSATAMTSRFNQVYDHPN